MTEDLSYCERHAVWHASTCEEWQAALDKTQVTVPADALRRLIQVAAYVSRGKSSMLGPYPGATARIALGALPDELLDLIREAPDA